VSVFCRVSVCLSAYAPTSIIIIVLQGVIVACFAERCISRRLHVRLSVCPTVLHPKTTQARIMKSSSMDSTRSLVLAWKVRPGIRLGIGFFSQ